MCVLLDCTLVRPDLTELQPLALTLMYHWRKQESAISLLDEWMFPLCTVQKCVQQYYLFMWNV